LKGLAVAYVLGLLPALAIALSLPVWSPVDEAGHYDVIAQYAAGVYPHDSITTIRPETLEVMKKTDSYGFVLENAFHRPDLADGFQTVPPGLPLSAHVLWIRRHGFQFSYEAYQPPLYYVAALPAWFLGDQLGGAMGAVYAVRVFDAVLAALLVPLTMLIAGRVWPANNAVAWTAGLMTAVLAGRSLNLAAVTNDVLASVLGTACVLVAISGRWTNRRAVLLGILFGAAMLTKITSIALAPALVLALMQQRRDGAPKAVALSAGAAGIVFMPWLGANLAMYGELLPTKEQLEMSAFPGPSTDPSIWFVSTLHAFVTFWTGEPFLLLPGAPVLAFLALFLVALAVAGFVHAWRQRSPEISRDTLVVLGVAAVGAWAISLTSPVLASFSAPGRLAYVGLGPVIVLVVVGLWVELQSPLLRRVMIGLFAGLSVLGLALLINPTASMPGNPGQPEVAHAEPLQASASFDHLRVDAKTCAVDFAGDTWLALDLVNEGSGPIEWRQSIEVDSSGRAVTTSDFKRSSQLPVALQPGSTYAGWFWIGPSSKLQHLADTSILLRDVAADGYQQIGTLTVRTSLC
jgi:hypothetical protein